MKILKHPLHVMLIHFPTALLPMDLILSFLFYRTGNESFGSAAFYCLIGGIAFGWLSGLTGLIDLILIKDRTALSAALVHGGINLAVILVFSVFAYKSWNLYPQLPVPALTALLIKLIMVITLLAGNYLGGRLIFKHHIGIEK